jgi:prepilin-type N-terminal cleavage/methylation domain-containing protein
MRSKRSQQSGFTLVEIAIVLVIIGLLLGGILKGQELINSAKVKNLANDFRTIPTFIYGYQDKYRALPGDDATALTHVGAPAANCGPPVVAPCGNGVINGLPIGMANTDESFLFWMHVRLALLASGPTAIASPEYLPKNAAGGNLGIASLIVGVNDMIKTPTPMAGTYQICSDGILGKIAKQLDITLDDGNTATGSMRAALMGTTVALDPTGIVDGNSYIVCATF